MVSIPLLSGPVLNLITVTASGMVEGLNPFAFRASAELLASGYVAQGDAVSIPLLSGPVLNPPPEEHPTPEEVSIPLLSGPVLNFLPGEGSGKNPTSQSLCFQGQC